MFRHCLRFNSLVPLNIILCIDTILNNIYIIETLFCVSFLWYSAEVNALTIDRILTNFANNALEHNSNSDAAIQISFAHYPPKNNTVASLLISVNDNGAPLRQCDFNSIQNKVCQKMSIHRRVNFKSNIDWSHSLNVSMLDCINVNQHFGCDTLQPNKRMDTNKTGIVLYIHRHSSFFEEHNHYRLFWFAFFVDA